MSFDAIRWAYEQPVKPALTKFVLLTMANCVNAEAGTWEFYASYRHIAERTGMNQKTVEASVTHLKQQGYIVDTGRRAGDTGKVVVYRLNDPESGVIKPGLQTPSANGTRPQNDTENGVITPPVQANEIPPKSAPNPPKYDGQSPQILGRIPPKTGIGTSKGTRNRTRKEPGTGAAVAAIPDVPDQLLADWLIVRKDKGAKTLTQTAVAGLLREASKAGIPVADAVRFCCEAGWVGFNAGWYGDRVGGSRAAPRNGRGQGNDWTGGAT